MTKILVVEDNKEITMLLTTILVKEGFSVDSVNGGYSLLTYLRDSKEPDGVILDLFLPERSGIELMSSLISKWTKTKIFIFSGQREHSESYLFKNPSIRGFFWKADGAHNLIAAIKKEFKLKNRVSSILCGCATFSSPLEGEGIRNLPTQRGREPKNVYLRAP
ncbi:MAG: response regulator [Candidatus Aureabacteria bacterium]|nr:response regulator [Candidatus Auribacterota bacterium]